MAPEYLTETTKRTSRTGVENKKSRVMNPEFLRVEKPTINRLVNEGLDPRKVWTTRLFYSQASSVRVFFGHAGYGIANNARAVDPEFHDHITKEPTRWFRGKAKERDAVTGVVKTVTSKVRAQLRERARREEISEGLGGDPVAWSRAMLFHQSLVLAHDMVVRDDAVAGGADSSTTKKKKMKEGGPKMFCLASPWQALYRISRKIQNGGVAADVSKLKSVRSASSSLSSAAWNESGQPLADWPACSLYNPRFDEMNETGAREYFFTLDVDGANAVPPRDDETVDEYRDRCADVIAEFENAKRSDRLPLITELTEKIREGFASVTNRTVRVSWHKTIGWKPSWRAYVVGVVFRDIDYAKHFVHSVLVPLCAPLIHARFPPVDDEHASLIDGVMDVGNTYGVGFDRCLGMAKLVSDDPGSMRFLEVKPMDRFSDPSLVSMFSACPNEYVLSVLGWMYPRTLDANGATEDPTALFLEYAHSLERGKRSASTSGGGGKTRRVGSGGSAPGGTPAVAELPEDAAKRASDLFAEVMRDAGLEKSWRGENVVSGRDGRGEYVEMFSAGTGKRFCAYRCLDMRDGDKENPRKGVAIRSKPKRHGAVGSERKIMFRAYFDRDRDDGRYWIRQNCFKCGGKLQYACALEPPGGDLRAHVFGTGGGGGGGTERAVEDDGGTREQENDDPNLALRDFGMDLCVAIDGIVRKLDDAFV